VEVGARNRMEESMQRLAVVCLMSLLAVSIWAEDSASKAPTGFRDVPFGAEISAARSKLEFIGCETPNSEISMCHVEDFNLGDVSVVNQLIFKNNRFVAGTISFKPTDYEYVKSVFVEKYGTPSSKRATENGEVLKWTFSTTVVLLMQRSTASDGWSLATIGEKSFIYGIGQHPSPKKAAKSF
jgi:hypothetical protein